MASLVVGVIVGALLGSFSTLFVINYLDHKEGDIDD